tara:strand:+ start:55 stop:633 length:579 start_codon:yes stop_codon:yes gene_type:complete
MDFKYLQDKLDNPTINSKQLLGTATLLNENDRESGAFTDPKYLPFYYHIGKQCEAKSLFHLDYALGLEDMCFIQGANSERWSGYANGNEENRLNVATNNVRFFCKNSSFTTDLDEFEKNVEAKFDAFIVTSPKPLRVFKDDIWNNLNPEGLLIVDNIYSSDEGEEWFTKFATSVSREPVFFKTRYGIGIIER